MCTTGPRQLCSDSECRRCFTKSFAFSDKAQFWSESNLKNPREVLFGSGNKFFFDCPCGHVILKALKEVTQKSWCGYCSVPSKMLCNNDSCDRCFNNSFASHEKSFYWSNNNSKSPRQVIIGSEKKYLFDCIVCHHTFDSSISDIVKSTSTGCPYCNNKKLCFNQECEFCFNNSFASSPRASNWSSKNTKKPREVSISNGRKFWFNCDKCPHELEIPLNGIAKGNFCAYCSHHKLCSNTECQYCFNNSFANSNRAKNWSEKNTKTPREVSSFSLNKYIFVCDNGHEFESLVSNVGRGSWCPDCKYKTQEKFGKFLKLDYPDTKYQVRYEWCKNIRHLPFDFVIEDIKIIIELDGKQHFHQVGNWNSPEDTREHDIIKIERAIENGYTIIHVLQEYVAVDRNPWKEMMTNLIEIYKGSNTVIFINETDEYKEHAKHFNYAIVHTVQDYINSQ